MSWKICNFQENKSGSSRHKSGLGTPLGLPAGKGHLVKDISLEKGKVD